MNQQERYKLRKHFKKMRWKKGKKLSKTELSNMAQGYLWVKHQPKHQPNWQPKFKKTEKIGDLLDRFKDASWRLEAEVTYKTYKKFIEWGFVDD